MTYDERETIKRQAGDLIKARKQIAALLAEVECLRAELVKVYEAVGSSKVRCPRCGGSWFVPDQCRGDPRFECPHCEAAEAAKENT